MATKKTAAEIAVDLTTEIDNQSLSGLEGFSKAIQEIAGSGAVGTEFVAMLKLALDELQNNKGTDAIKVITKELKAAKTELESIIRLESNPTGRNTKVKNLTNKMMNNITTSKVNTGAALSKTEAKFYKDFQDIAKKLNDNLEKEQQIKDSLIEMFNKIKDTDPAKARETLRLLQEQDKIYRRAKYDAEGTKSPYKKDLERRVKTNADRELLLEELGIAEEMKRMKEQARLSNYYGRAKNGERSKKQFYNNEGIRKTLWLAEDNYNQRRGFIGGFARFGGYLFKNKNFGDAFNNGIPGAGINMGTVAFGGVATAAFAAGKALKSFADITLKAYGEIDKIKANLSVVYGGRGSSEKIFEEIAQYAIKSPFSVAQTAEHAVLLKQTGVEESQVMKTLKVFGDLAGGNQDKLNRLIENFSKINANEYVTARNMQQFAMAGIPIYKALADQLGIRTSEVRDKVSKREVSSDDVMKALTKLTEKGGMFYNAVEIGSKTYDARKTNLEDTLQLANAATGERLYKFIGEDFLEFKEYWAGVYRDDQENKVHKGRIAESLALEAQLNDIDERIKEAELKGFSESYIKELKVQRMEVQNASSVAGGLNEAELARKFEEFNRNAFSYKFDKKELDKLVKEYVDNSILSTDIGYVVVEGLDKGKHGYTDDLDVRTNKYKLDADLARYRLEQYGLTNKDMWFAHNTFSILDRYVGSKIDPTNILAGYNYTGEDLSKFYQSEIKNKYYSRNNKGLREWQKNTSLERYVGNGEFTRNFTPYEKYGYKLRGQELSKESGSNLRELGKDKNSTSALVERFDKWYKTTIEAKAEQEASDKEMIDTLKDIYKERESFGMSEDNKFAFMEYRKDANGNIVKNDEGSLRAEEIYNILQRQFDLKNTQDLVFDEESFDENIEKLRENINGLGKNIKNVFISSTGNSASGSVAKSYIDRILKAKDSTTVNYAISEFKKFTDSFGNNSLSRYVEAMFSDLQLAEIDPIKLEAKKKERSISHTYDTSLSPLIRELTEKYLGVSLYRTIGTGLGTLKRYDNDGINATLSYAKNNQDREMLNTIANALLSQTGSSRLKVKDVSSFMKRRDGSFYKQKNQQYLDKDGKVYDKKTSTGRYIKGFYDIDISRKQMEYYALTQGRAGTVKAIANEYEKIEDNLNKFFTELMTSKESKDATAKYAETQASIEAKYKIYEDLQKKGKLTSAQQDDFTALKALRDDLEETSALKTLGIEENELYRNSVTALTLDIYKASDGTKKYVSVYAEALDMLKEEVHERGLMIGALSDFRQAVEDINNKIKGYKWTAATEDFTVLQNAALDNVIGYENKKLTMESLKSVLSNEKYEEIIKKAYGDMGEAEILTNILNRSRKLTGEEPTLDVLATRKNTGTFYDSKEYLDFEKKVGKPEDLINLITGENTVEAKETTILSNPIKQLEELGFSISDDTKALFGKKDYRVFSEKYLEDNKGKYTNDFDSVDEARSTLMQLLIRIFEEMAYKNGTSLNSVKYTQEEAQNALAVEFRKIGDASSGLYSSQQMSAFEQARTAKMFEAQDRGVSLYGGWTNLYGNNNAREQSALAYLGLKPETDWSSLISKKYLDSNGFANLNELDKLKQMRADVGLSNKDLETDEYGLIDVDKIEKAEAEFWNLKKLIDSAGHSLENLAKSMESAFDSAIVDGISNSMVILGESMRDGVDATDNINKGLKETFTNLLKSIGPQMTQTGLAIAAGAAADNKWGLVAGGIGLAAAGGFLSYTGGLLSDSSDDKDDEAQKEARLKSLADILSDLIDQAKTDAEYYERNIRHTNALSADYDVSSRKVNDMILTPSGTFSTHPEDTIMAMKHPEDLMYMGAGKNAGTVVNFQIINQAGDKVRVEEQRTEDENGNVDIKAVIVAVTSEAIANGDMDGAFAQMQSRHNGVTRTF